MNEYLDKLINDMDWGIWNLGWTLILLGVGIAAAVYWAWTAR